MPRQFQFSLRSLLLLMVFLGISLGIGKWSYDAYVARQPAKLPWKPFTRSEMSQLKTGSRPVLVFFTADWDLNCMFILRQSLGDHEVAAELTRRRFEFRLADWTTPNADVEQALEEYQSRSIPLIMIHPVGKFDEPFILRDLVSKGELLEAIERATNPSKKE